MSANTMCTNFETVGVFVVVVVIVVVVVVVFVVS
jgi:hypothetical protein